MEVMISKNHLHVIQLRINRKSCKWKELNLFLYSEEYTQDVPMREASDSAYLYMGWCIRYILFSSIHCCCFFCGNKGQVTTH